MIENIGVIDSQSRPWHRKLLDYAVPALTPFQLKTLS